MASKFGAEVEFEEADEEFRSSPLEIEPEIEPEFEEEELSEEEAKKSVDVEERKFCITKGYS